ncbi:MAG: hypothetical protein V1897_19640, partial [Pseudomonadota bacterium]
MIFFTLLPPKRGDYFAGISTSTVDDDSKMLVIAERPVALRVIQFCRYQGSGNKRLQKKQSPMIVTSFDLEDQYLRLLGIFRFNSLGESKGHPNKKYSAGC